MSATGATFGRFPAFGKTLPESDPIWQMESMAIRRGTAPLYCRNLLLTIDVRPFLSNAADTPATGNNDVGREPDRTANGRLCRRRRATTLSGGVMPFGKIEKMPS
ncbi:MAG: hypothetical protein EOR04_23800 [Mesorhizobium sp.]|uniref:hypothetical protein n=1 Tax=Mesorhizobium sp. TaxID=1871066 RepID=UPI000FE843D9|nr:hypothetical protein [Mesorhizobium sp.]RWP39267.1 MAG: hypothetical protein EOR04_23800 [Mesorhizobium sp.]